MMLDILMVCSLGYLVVLPGNIRAKHQTEMIPARAAATAFVHAARGGSFSIGSSLVQCELTHVTGWMGKPDDTVTLYY